MWWASYVAAATISTLFMVVLFKALEERRMLTTPAEPQPAAGAMTPTLEIPLPAGDGPLTDAELAPFRSRGRKLSVFMIVLGVGALAWLDHLIKAGDKVPMKLLAIVAIGLTFGVGGLFEPLMMYRHTPAGKRFPRRAHFALFVCLLIAAGVGYGVVQYYGLH